VSSRRGARRARRVGPSGGRAPAILLAIALWGLGAAPACGADPADAADVIRKHGQPSGIWFDASGREVWDYDGNPFRFSGLRFRFDPDGRLNQSEETRNESAVASVATGMSARVVRETLGEPPTMYFIRDEAHWEWRIWWAGRAAHRLVVQFDKNGVVKAVGKYRIDGKGLGGMR
jgi:hypothetical protein